MERLTDRQMTIRQTKLLALANKFRGVSVVSVLVTKFNECRVRITFPDLPEPWIFAGTYHDTKRKLEYEMKYHN